MLRRNFFWQGNEDKKKFHLFKWEEIMKSKKEGGVGIKNMKMQNRSLLMKWLWRFITGENMLWKELICGKYEMEDKWITKMVTTPYGCSIWRSIRNLWPLLLSRINFKVGNGLKVAFWEDKWIAQRTLKQLLPDLHLLCSHQQATVVEMWTGQGWNLHLRRNLNDWEVDKIGSLYNTLAPFNNLTGEKDIAIWKVGNKGVFSVNSVYNNLTTLSNRMEQWPWEMIWGTKIPYKVNCFTWQLTREVVLTQENMKKRKYQLSSRCYLCEAQTETVNHLFLHCKWADQLWRLFICLRKITWVKPKNIEGVLKCWMRVGNATKKEERWKIVPACIWWTMWKERNQRYFEAFKTLGKMILDVGLLLAYHCDRYASREMVMLEGEGLEQTLVQSRCHKGRLLYYFPAQYSSPAHASMSSWCGWHTDHGSLTGLTRGMFARDGVEIHCPDSAAGLYVKTRTGQIVKVEYGVDEIAYQIGETTEILSSGRLCATPHCVRAPRGDAASGVDRTTFALFMQPDWDQKLYFPGEVHIHRELIQSNGSLTFGEYTEKLLDKYYHLKM